jgi:cation diffusion facilitator family transporter
MATRLELEEIASGHDFLGKAHDRNARRTVWVVVLTSVMMVAEIVAGYLTGSMALLADGYHMATHAGALGIAALAYRFARRHVANPRYSFGTGKVGDLAGFASAIVLGIVALGIGTRSAIRLVHPVSIVYEEATLVAVIGLAVNIASALLLMGGPTDHAHDHGHAHAQAHDNNLRAAYFHVLADAVTSVLAIVALVAGWKLGWVWLDPVIGVVGGVVIARWSWGLIRDTSAMLLDEADAQLMDEVRSALGELAPGVRDLHVWRIGPQAHGAIVSLCGNADAEEVRRRLAAVHEIAHLTVEVLPSRR